MTDPFILQVKDLQKQGLLGEAEVNFALEKNTADDKKMKMIFQAFSSNKDQKDFAENLTKYYKRSQK